MKQYTEFNQRRGMEMSGVMRYLMEIRGMTCTDCKNHVEAALDKAGAWNIKANFRRGEALFAATRDFSFDAARRTIAEAGYHVVGMQELEGEIEWAVTQDASSDYDWVVIGSGSAAFSSAIEARRLGARVAMVERGTIGGTCVNVGCVPSKTMLRAADLYHLAGNNPFPSLHTSQGSVDLVALVSQKNELIETLRQQKYEDLIAEYEIDLVQGEAHFVDDRRIQVGDRLITSGHYLIATGARPRIPDIVGIDQVNYLTSTSALDLMTVPEHLIVVGSGYIALELGQLFRRWGSRVTLIQRGSVLMPGYDVEIRQVMGEMLADAGIEVVLGAGYQHVDQIDGLTSLYITVKGQARVIKGDALLIAAGRDPNTEALNLAAAGINIGPGGEPLHDATLQTTNPRVYVAGDVTLGPQFVYVAAYEGKTAAQNALGGVKAPRPIDLSVVPAVTFTQPSLASVGLSEEQAEQEGIMVKTSVLPLDALARALANRETRGLIKLVAERDTGRIRGAQIVADNAGDVIYAATLAVKFKMTINDLTDTLAPYLTMAEGIKLAALTFDQDVHKLSCCAG